MSSFKVWIEIEELDEQGEPVRDGDGDPAPVGSFATRAEAEAFARTIGWAPFNEHNEYESGAIERRGEKDRA